MTPVLPHQFVDFFRAVDGNQPFPWQERLAARVCAGSWPKALALPTASGKTACLDIAIFALACQATLPAAERIAPRRIAFVVDRRVIVDEAFDRARRIARYLRTASGQDGVPRPIFGQVAAALRHIGGLSADADPLVCAQLRGGIYRDTAWAANPTQPIVLASTVDQVGSRLVFRGYGVSDSLKPIHAGLLGNDCLILLDEAHCARPFAQSAAAISQYRRWSDADRPLLPFHFVIMSATPPAGHDDDTFRLDENTDLAPEALGPRVHCPKPVQLLVEPVTGGAKGQEKFASRLVDHAGRMVEQSGLQAIAILVNRVNTARLVHEICRKRWPESKADAVCLTGRMRPYDRDRIVRHWGPLLRPDKDRPRRQRPVFVTATQCLEVGANLDFEGMVTECASLDALRQRFGRLKRLGLGPAARAVISIRQDDVKTEEEIAKEAPAKKDPVYGDALPRTWNWLCSHASMKPDESGQEQRFIDFGISALDRILPTEDNARELLQAPSSDAPIMLPAHVDCWVQTKPLPQPDPDVALFLHGPQRGLGEVRVCWRADLSNDPPVDQSHARWKEIVALCPPTAAECMPVPLPVILAWLRQDPDLPPPVDETSDLEQTSEPPSTKDDEKTATRRYVLRWCGPDDPATALLDDLSKLRTGDTLIVPAKARWAGTLGQLPDHAGKGQSGWNLDIAELTARLSRRRAILRLLPDRIESWPEGSARADLKRIACDSSEPENEGDDLRRSLRSLADHDDFPAELRDIVLSLASDKRLKIHRYPHYALKADNELDSDFGEPSPGGLILIGSSVLPPEGEERASCDGVTGEDDASSATVSVSLVDHTNGVAEYVRRSADCFGLPKPLRAALVMAARFHDLGKADHRFQAWLHNGNTRLAAIAPKPLAKSGGLPQSPAQREKARVRSGYPRGARHELVSMALAADHLDETETSLDRDLVLHLIASHHGHARPLAPFVDDTQPVDIEVSVDETTLRASSATGLHQLGSGVAERFWCLVRRYGWWHLAWLETLLRLADHRCSQDEQDNPPDEVP